MGNGSLLATASSDPGERPAPGWRPTANDVVAEAQKILAIDHGIQMGFKQVDRHYRKVLAERRKRTATSEFIVATEGAYAGSGTGLRLPSARVFDDPVGELAADLADGIMRWKNDAPPSISTQDNRKSGSENSTKSSLEAALTYAFDTKDQPHV